MDLSPYLVHFTKGEDGYNAIMSILWERRLRPGPNPFGAARKIAEIADSERAVCFSEVPLGLLDRITERRKSLYGIGFTKTFITKKRGAPVWYVEWGSPQHSAIESMVADAEHNGPDQDDPLWKISR